MATRKKTAARRKKGTNRKKSVKSVKKQPVTTKKRANSKTPGQDLKTTQPTEATDIKEFIMVFDTAKFDQFSQDAAQAGREQVEAFVQSGTILAKGMEGFVKAYTTLAQETAEKNAQAFKSLMACKTLNEFTEAQSTLARQNLDGLMAGMTQLSELGVKLATEAYEPINDQVSKAVKKATDLMAA